MGELYRLSYFAMKLLQYKFKYDAADKLHKQYPECIDKNVQEWYSVKKSLQEPV